jgi:quinol monooxygenase YgiN
MSKFALLIAVSAGLMVEAAQNAHVGAAADVPLQSAGAAGFSSDTFHVAIFRFAKEHIKDAMAAFRELATASRSESGNLGYDVYRGKDDAQEFYVVEHWASTAALAAHEHSEAFIRFGQGVLVRYSTLHDTVTARAFDVVKPPLQR